MRRALLSQKLTSGSSPAILLVLMLRRSDARQIVAEERLQDDAEEPLEPAA